MGIITSLIICAIIIFPLFFSSSSSSSVKGDHLNTFNQNIDYTNIFLIRNLTLSVFFLMIFLLLLYLYVIDNQGDKKRKRIKRLVIKRLFIVLSVLTCGVPSIISVICCYCYCLGKKTAKIIDDSEFKRSYFRIWFSATISIIVAYNWYKLLINMSKNVILAWNISLVLIYSGPILVETYDKNLNEEKSMPAEFYSFLLKVTRG